jgi:hypothetical protein
MKSSPFLVEPDAGRDHYTHLFACISEEDDSYVVQVRLYNQLKPQNTAWGEETTDSFEAASMVIADLAAQYSIAQDQIEIDIRMHTAKGGTRH